MQKNLQNSKHKKKQLNMHNMTLKLYNIGY